jgi:hypothetical protein
MSDLPPYRDTSEAPDRGSTPGAPLWVRVVGIIIVIVLVLLVVVLHLTGAVGPGGH